LTITRQGFAGAVFVLLRTTASLGCILLLVKSTRWPVLTGAIGSLGVPSIFVMALDLTYRYIFLFLTLLYDYILGRKSRLVALENSRSRFEWIGSALAGFFRLSLEYSRDITFAMLARGYTGDNENKERLPLRLKTPDWCFILMVIIIGAWGGGIFAKL
jgi:cobalt/nickel transport system permease protein